ncbi:MAG: RNA polymerase sigma factor [Armatimonadetes bacterium]|nr:RNA polymerase sigma factor [Armatimonadota bacterium]
MRKRIASDDELMSAAAGGDASAFAELVRRHRGWVRSLAYAFVQNEEQAEDLTQEIFCRVYDRKDRYDPEGKFVPWLKRIAVNLAKDALRRGKRREVLSWDELDVEIADERAFDPMEALASDALHADLRDALQTLPDEQRLALAMHYFGNMSLQDIAWAMKCPVGTVKSRLFNGLRRVRRTLTEQWENEGENDDR